MASAMMLALRNLSAMGLCRSGRWLAPSALKVVRQISSSSSSSGVPQTAVHGKPTAHQERSLVQEDTDNCFFLQTTSSMSLGSRSGSSPRTRSPHTPL